MMNLNLPQDWPNSSSSHQIRTDDILWHVQIQGNAPSHLLLLHGTGSSAHTWGNLFQDLSKKYTVVAPDLPGHGFTKFLNKQSLNLDELSQQLSKLREALQIEYFDHIIGHSAGATLALNYALKNEQPKTITGLNPSLINLPSFYHQFIAPLINPIVTSSLFSAVLCDLLPHTRMIDGLIDSTKSQLGLEQRGRYKELFRNADHLNGSMSFMAGTDINQLLEKSNMISASLTFILSEDDGWIPIESLRKVIQKYFSQAKVIEVRGGHLFHEVNESLALELIENSLATKDST